MKVLMINSVCGFGSTGRICTDLASVLMQNGHEVKIAYGRGKTPDKFKENSYRIGNNFIVNLNALKARLLDNEGFGAKRATQKFLKWADEYNPDIIHLHNLHGYYINVKLLFDWIKSRPNMKVLWTLHDCWAFTGHCSHFDYVGCDKYKILCYACEQKCEYPKSLFFDKSKHNYLRKKSAFTSVKNLTIITPSKWLKEKVECSFLKEYKTVVINNGIDLTVFKPTKSDFKEKYGLQDKKIILGVASVWGKRKGFNDFVELSKIIPNEYKIVMVGLSKQQLRKLPKNILGINRTASVKELAEIYSASDVFFNPTYEDNYPTVNLEAQACGLPVITYRTGGSVESVPNKNILEKGDYNGFLQKLGEDFEVLEIKQGKNEVTQEYMCFYTGE